MSGPYGEDDLEREVAKRAAGCVLDSCWKPICDASCTCPPCRCPRCWARLAASGPVSASEALRGHGSGWAGGVGSPMP
jgi:hypothetical protein